MKRILVMTIAALALCAGSAAAKDIRKLVLTTNPVMHCQNCENKIKNHLKFEKGIKKIETSVKAQTVTVTYDAEKTTEKAIIDAFPKIKYEAKKVDSKAKDSGTDASTGATTSCH